MTGLKKSLYYSVALLLIVLLSGCSGNDTDQKRRPNILLILADDLGNNDIASWGDGRAPTPTLDRLSRESVRFRQHYTDSTCSPSRAALLTGRQPARIGFLPTALGLSSDLTTLPEQLKGLGYRTIHLGKWHVGEALEYPEIQPARHGFDYWFGMLNHFVLQGPGPGGEIISRQPTHINPWLQENGAAPKRYQGYLDDILTDKAIEQLQSARGQPWFINLWLFSPHTPYQPAPQFAARFPATPEGRFLAVMAQLDHNVDRLLQALDASGQADNTIVVLASDNGGPNIARDNNWPFVGKKATYLEGGQRTPLLLRWPKHFEDRDIRPVTTIMDIFPTLVELAGGAVPEGLDGQSLVGLLQGAPYHPPQELFFAADDSGEGMTFGGRDFSRKQLFYRAFKSQLVTANIPAPFESSAATDTLAVSSLQEAGQLIRDWEARTRPLALTWEPGKPGMPGVLSGLDFQRAPVFEGYTIGLSLDASANLQSKSMLIEQPGVWSVQLLPDRRLRVTHGNTQQLSQPIRDVASCNSLIISLKVRPGHTFPFPSTPTARLTAYWNTQLIMDSHLLLTRPGNAGALAAATYIGARPDGDEAFQGHIERPVVMNKFLQADQEGYNLSSLERTLCAKRQ